MNRKHYLFLFISTLICITFYTQKAYSDVKVTINNNEYVLPVAELAGTKTYPNIIEIENDYIQIKSIPNRGRIISSFVIKKTGQEIFYNNYNPKPMILSSGLHAVEFGGSYLSVPWNTRDRQPFDLNYEIKERSPDNVVLYLSGKDMFKKTLTEIWIKVVADRPFVELTTKISNYSSKNDTSIDLRDFFIIYGKNKNVETELVLPMNTALVIDSMDNWLAKKEATVNITDKITKWKSINNYYRIRTAIDKENNFIACRRLLRRGPCKVRQGDNVQMLGGSPQNIPHGRGIIRHGPHAGLEHGVAPGVRRKIR
ncbi:MAG: hypothetical protein AB1798_05825 [Spirochaetota bacterium]